MNVEIIEFICIAVFFACFYGLITSNSILKSIALVLVKEGAVIMFFLSMGFNSRAVPPIGPTIQYMEYVADPLPQALMITAVIVGLATTAINITMFITLFRKFKSADWNEVKKLSAEA